MRAKGTRKTARSWFITILLLLAPAIDQIAVTTKAGVISLSGG
ncbi:hypothetical protein [Methylocystis sp. MJC1]|nr:hypothetical protein [Methylocystis sp. MJC1]